MTIDRNWDYPRETTEYVFFDELLVNGVIPTTQDIEYALTRGLGRPKPEDWADISEKGGKKCFLLTPQLESGKLKVWVRVADAPEATVIEVGHINIT